MSSDYQLEDTLYLPFTTRAFATGIPTVLVSGAVDIYEDVTATPIITGETLAVSLNSVVGFNMITVTATAATGFEAGKSYTAILQAGTVDSVSVVGEVVAHFTMQKSAAVSAIGGIGTAGGAALQVDAKTSNEGGGITGVTSGTTIVGTPTNTYTSTSVLDGTSHIIADATNAIDIVYQFLTGGGTSPVSVSWTGYVTGSNDTVTLSVWNHVGAAWEQISTIGGTNGTTTSVINPVLYTRHRGTSAAELGKVYVRLHCTGQSSPTLNTDQLFVSYAVTSRTVGYANGSVWVDTVSGIAGTESFVSGVADNPVLTFADGLTIATANNLRKFWIGNGSTVTLAATLANKVLEGHEWTLALGGQNIADSMFIDAEVTGTATGSNPEFEDCVFGITSSEELQCYNCSFTATTSGGFTMSAAGDYRFINCQSGVAGASAPLFTLGTGAITAEFRRWSGGITLAGVTADDVLTISGEMGTIDLGSPSGTADIQIRGTYKAITNAGSAVVNVTGAILGGDVATTWAAVGTAGAGLTDLGGMSTAMKAEINTEVVDALNVDTYAEPAQGAPLATTSLAAKLNYLYKFWRNHKENDGTQTVLYADDTTTVDHIQQTTVTSNTVSLKEWITGP